MHIQNSSLDSHTMCIFGCWLSTSGLWTRHDHANCDQQHVNTSSHQFFQSELLYCTRTQFDIVRVLYLVLGTSGSEYPPNQKGADDVMMTRAHNVSKLWITGGSGIVNTPTRKNTVSSGRINGDSVKVAEPPVRERIISSLTPSNVIKLLLLPFMYRHSDVTLLRSTFTNILQLRVASLTASSRVAAPS